MTDDSSDESQEWWDARITAIEGVLGESDELQGHAIVPFEFGLELGGGPDLLYFHKHLTGVVTVTCELIGSEQPTNHFGQYELMVCEREESKWGEKVISRLAYYTLESILNPGQTMSIGSAVPSGATITALLFIQYAQFRVRDYPAGLLLCIGITADELKACREGRRIEVEEALKSAGVFPFTDLFRQSVIIP